MIQLAGTLLLSPPSSLYKLSCIATLQTSVSLRLGNHAKDGREKKTAGAWEIGDIVRSLLHLWTFVPWL